MATLTISNAGITDLSTLVTSPVFEVALAQAIQSAGAEAIAKGVGHLLAAMYHIGGERHERALAECAQARAAWPQGEGFLSLAQGMALTHLRQYEEADKAFQISHSRLPLFSQSAGIGEASPAVADWQARFYQLWAATGLLQGLDGAARGDLAAFRAGGAKIVAVLQIAERIGQAAAVWNLFDVSVNALPPTEASCVAEFRRFVEIIALKDPEEQMAAIRRAITAVWPQDWDCVDAVREQRR